MSRHIAALLLLLSMTRTGVAQEAIEPNAAAAVAWHLDSWSDELLRSSRLEPAFRLSAALLDGAGRLDPQEPRFPRLRTLALVQLGDVQGAISSLIAYRNLRAGDKQAQVQLIDLYAATQETLDAKLNYLNSQVANPKLAPEVQAVLAIEVASLLAQKSPDEAAKMVTRAVQIYPIPEATREYYRYSGSKLPLPQRVAALLAVLKADPNQPAYMHELGALLAGNGMSEESLIWFDGAKELSAEGRSPAYHTLLIDYAAQLIISGKPALADTVVGRVLTNAPLDADAWFLRLTLDKDSPQARYAETVMMARGAFVRRWNVVARMILSGKPATEPADNMNAVQEEMAPKAVDAAPVLAKLKADTSPQGHETVTAIAALAGDFAWFELYFARDAHAATSWIDLYRALEGDNPNDATALTRLAGWEALAARDLPKARDILSTVAAKDPLAQLGLIDIAQQQNQPVDPTAVQTLLDKNRTGLVAAILWNAFKANPFHPRPNPLAAQVNAELNKFPQEFLEVLTLQSAPRIYSLRAEPLQTSITFGAPVLVQVTAENTSSYDLTIGRDSLLRPELSLDAQTLGLNQQPFYSVASDTLSGQIVLRPHEMAGQVVRLDVGELRYALDSAPGADTTVNGDVVSNPIAMPLRSGNGEIGVPGPGGITANFFRTFTYSGIPITRAVGKQDLDKLMTSKTESDRIHAADLLAAFIRLAKSPNSDASVRQLASEIPKTLGTLRNDPNTAVAAWASCMLASISPPDQQQEIIEKLSASADWSSRLLSLLAGRNRSGDKWKQQAAKLANDPDPTVKAAAIAIIDLVEQTPNAPTTQPAATQPATAPITQPAIAP